MIYLHSPGWGSTGPDSDRQSFAPLLSASWEWGTKSPAAITPPFPVGNEDPGNGMLGAVGILMALFHRHRTSLGQLVESPQLNAAMVDMAHIVRTSDGVVLGADRLDPVQLWLGSPRTPGSNGRRLG